MAQQRMSAKNTFGEGLIMDFAPDNTQANVLTNALNATLLTFNGNEMSLQNDMGNGRVESAFLPEGYIPVGTCEFGDIIYIVSYNPLIGKSQIGCFPSPERNISNKELSDIEASININEFYNGTPVSNSVKKIIWQKSNLNPGDKFIISITNSRDDKEITALQKSILSNYGNTSHDRTTVENYWPKMLDIHVISIEESGKITYLDDSIKWYNNDYYISSEKIDSTEASNIDEYRHTLSSNYSVFQSRTPGKLALLIELETINNFSCGHRTVKNGPNDDTYDIYISSSWETDNYNINPGGFFFEVILNNENLTITPNNTDDLNTTDDLDNEDLENTPDTTDNWPASFSYSRLYEMENPGDNYWIFKLNSFYSRDYTSFNTLIKINPENTKTNLLEKDYIVTKLLALWLDKEFTGNYIINPEILQEGYKRWENNEYVDCSILPINDDVLVNTFKKSSLKKVCTVELPNDTPEESNTISFTYKVTPYMSFSNPDGNNPIKYPLDHLSIINTVVINKAETGDVNLSTWKYYVDTNSITLNFGFDTYLNESENEVIDAVLMEFYDNMGLCANYLLKNLESYDSKFTEYIELDLISTNFRMSGKEFAETSRTFSDKYIYHTSDEVLSEEEFNSLNADIQALYPKKDVNAENNGNSGEGQIRKARTVSLGGNNTASSEFNGVQIKNPTTKVDIIFGESGDGTGDSSGGSSGSSSSGGSSEESDTVYVNIYPNKKAYGKILIGDTQTQLGIYVKKGSELKIKAIAENGCRFVSWSDDSNISESERTIIVSEPIDICAHFELLVKVNSLQVTYNNTKGSIDINYFDEENPEIIYCDAEKNGEINTVTVTASQNCKVALTATAKSGYKFSKWIEATKLLTLEESSLEYSYVNYEQNPLIVFPTAKNVSYEAVFEKYESDAYSTTVVLGDYKRLDSGILYYGRPYLVKIKIYKGILDELGNIDTSSHSNPIEIIRWLWTAPVFNEHYKNLNDFNNCSLNLQLDCSTQFDGTNLLTNHAAYIPNTKSSVNLRYTSLGALVDYINMTDSIPNLGFYGTPGFTENYGQSIFLDPGAYKNVNVTVGIARPRIEIPELDKLETIYAEGSGTEILLLYPQTSVYLDEVTKQFGESLKSILGVTKELDSPELKKQELYSAESSYKDYRDSFDLSVTGAQFLEKSTLNIANDGLQDIPSDAVMEGNEKNSSSENTTDLTKEISISPEKRSLEYLDSNGNLQNLTMDTISFTAESWKWLHLILRGIKFNKMCATNSGYIPQVHGDLKPLVSTLKTLEDKYNIGYDGVIEIDDSGESNESNESNESDKTGNFYFKKVLYIGIGESSGENAYITMATLNYSSVDTISSIEINVNGNSGNDSWKIDVGHEGFLRYLPDWVFLYPFSPIMLGRCYFNCSFGNVSTSIPAKLSRVFGRDGIEDDYKIEDGYPRFQNIEGNPVKCDSDVNYYMGLGVSYNKEGQSRFHILGLDAGLIVSERKSEKLSLNFKYKDKNLENIPNLATAVTALLYSLKSLRGEESSNKATLSTSNIYYTDPAKLTNYNEIWKSDIVVNLKINSDDQVTSETDKQNLIKIIPKDVVINNVKYNGVLLGVYIEEILKKAFNIENIEAIENNPIASEFKTHSNVTPDIMESTKCIEFNFTLDYNTDNILLYYNEKFSIVESNASDLDESKLYYGDKTPLSSTSNLSYKPIVIKKKNENNESSYLTDNIDNKGGNENSSTFNFFRSNSGFKDAFSYDGVLKIATAEDLRYLENSNSLFTIYKHYTSSDDCGICVSKAHIFNLYKK